MSSADSERLKSRDKATEYRTLAPTTGLDRVAGHMACNRLQFNSDRSRTAVTLVTPNLLSLG
jgi:hypothetical protein